MKKLFLSLFISLLLFGCASTNVEKHSNSFNYSYDDIKDVNYIVHDDMELKYIYNLRDSMTGERENIRVYIANDSLLLSVNYQYSSWAFFNSVVFLGNGSRLQLDLGKRSSSVISGTVVREQYDSFLYDSDIEKLRDILSGNSVEVAFLGDSYNTGKLKMSSKIINAMLATFNKYEELK